MRLKRLVAIYEEDGEEEERVLFELGRRRPGGWSRCFCWTDDGQQVLWSQSPPEGWEAFLKLYGYGSGGDGQHPVPGPGPMWSYPAGTSPSGVDFKGHLTELSQSASFQCIVKHVGD